MVQPLNLLSFSPDRITDNEPAVLSLSTFVIYGGRSLGKPEQRWSKPSGLLPSPHPSFPLSAYSGVGRFLQLPAEHWPAERFSAWSECASRHATC
jgi:hypothetical protein